MTILNWEQPAERRPTSFIIIGYIASAMFVVVTAVFMLARGW